MLLLLPQFKTLLIADTLYHEIGHHIHELEQPGYRSNKEGIADEWKEKLLRSFIKRRYWYLAPIVIAFAPIVRPLLLRLDRSDKTERIDGTSL